MSKDVTPYGLEYDYETAGPQGCRFFLYYTKATHPNDLLNSKKWLRKEHDVVSLKIIETK